MQAPHNYPVGVQVFEDIRTQGYLYADKTAYVWDMLTMGGKYRFLSRPRRFGKTLLVSTLEAYFRGRRDLFCGLAIERLDPRDAWEAHPVIRLDLSDFKGTEEDQLAQKFDRMFRPYEEAYGITERAELPGIRLDDLIRAAAATEDGANGVVVLVDEYDAPLLNVVHDLERLQRFREVMREFYSPLKKNEENLRFVFITGITKFSQLSIFSELNNLLIMSMLPQYAGICGITASELDEGMADDVAYLAERLHITPEECRERLRERYDGYRFSRESPEIYNPFSLVTAFATGEIADHWFDSGTPTSLLNVMRKSGVSVPRLEGARASGAVLDAPAEGMDDPIAFMYQSGYLTIKGYSELTRTYTLGIPNAEVAEGLYGALLPACSGRPASDATAFVADFTDAVFGGDMDGALCLLRSFLALIPYDLSAGREREFELALFLIFKLVGANVRTEVAIATGRIDVTIDVPDRLYVMELKYRPRGEGHPNAEDAVAQIGQKGYLVPFEAGAKPVVEVGVAYSEEARTLDDDWVIREA